MGILCFVIHDIMILVVLFIIFIHSEPSLSYCNCMYALISCHKSVQIVVEMKGRYPGVIGHQLFNNKSDQLGWDQNHETKDKSDIYSHER